MSGHGGKREGAGRKARHDERKIPISLKIDRDIGAYLQARNKTETIEAAIRGTKAFREWRKYGE